MSTTKVLVIDNELPIRKLLEIGLSSYGYDVTTKSNAKEGLATVIQQHPGMILIDVSLEAPLDGLELCRELRKWNKTPIIMLTERTEKTIRLAALNIGVDDYVIKPFDMDELEARIRAILRRSVSLQEAAPSLHQRICIRDLVIDLGTRQVTLAGERVHLTPKEYELLRILSSYPGRVLTFHMLLEGVWGNTPKPKHNVHVLINNIRKKLKDDLATSHTPHYIHNEPGIGYRFSNL